MPIEVVLEEDCWETLDLVGLANRGFYAAMQYFELNPKYSRKYLIPQNYIKHSEVKRGDILINEFYIKK